MTSASPTAGLEVRHEDLRFGDASSPSCRMSATTPTMWQIPGHCIRTSLPSGSTLPKYRRTTDSLTIATFAPFLPSTSRTFSSPNAIPSSGSTRHDGAVTRARTLRWRSRGETIDGERQVDSTPTAHGQHETADARVDAGHFLTRSTRSAMNCAWRQAADTASRQNDVRRRRSPTSCSRSIAVKRTKLRASRPALTSSIRAGRLRRRPSRRRACGGTAGRGAAAAFLQKSITLGRIARHAGTSPNAHQRRS